MCKVPALCIDHIEHEEDFHTRACPQRGDIYVGNERSMGAGKRLTEGTVGQDKATRKTESPGEGSRQYEHRTIVNGRLIQFYCA